MLVLAALLCECVCCRRSTCEVVSQLVLTSPQVSGFSRWGGWVPSFCHDFVVVCYPGEAIVPGDEGIWDNYRVKRTLLHSW